MPPVVFEKNMPAGGSSSAIDNFCNFTPTIEQNQKNYPLPKSTKTKSTGVKKTVNVF